MSENITIVKAEDKKTKNPKRVSAGKKGAEAKKMKAELKRKEMETMKKENIQLSEKLERSPIKSITKDDDEVTRENQYKIFICLIGVVGLGIYMYKFKQVAPIKKAQNASTKFEKKEIDPFEFK